MEEPKTVRIEFDGFGKLSEAAKGRREEWSWDGVIPANDLTLIAAYMKKGKTTLLTGYVSGLLRSGIYCGRGVRAAKRVLYLAPEEGDTLVRKFLKLGFDGLDESQLTVVPRGSSAFETLVKHYRLRQWPAVVAGLREAGYDHVVLDGLHTLLHMFEPLGKEDNEGVGGFMSHFMLPFGSDFTVVAALHTKKLGGDPRIKVPPEERVRGASAWLAHPGQVLVMERDERADVNTFHAFGRYAETTTVEGLVVRYDKEAHSYVALGEPSAEEEAAQIVGEVKGIAVVQAKVREVLRKAGGAGLTTEEVKDQVTARSRLIREALDALLEAGVARASTIHTKKRPKLVWTLMRPKETGEMTDEQ